MSSQEFPDNVSPLKYPSILLAEDNEDEALLLRRAFSKTGIHHSLIHVPDGEAAIVFLNECGQGSRDWPTLVLLDIKMPRLTGLEVLNWVRSRPEFVSLPVVMMTSSALQQDIDRAIQLGATDYIVKPATFESLVKTVRTINERWLRNGEGVRF